MIGVVLVYAGLLGLVVGLIGLVRPPAWLAIRTRGRAGAVAAAGLGLTLAGFVLPAPEQRIDRVRTQLDEFAPVYQFHELHRRAIDAPPQRVFEAIEAVSAEEITLFRVLTWLRRFGRSGPEDILNAPERQPLLSVATRTTFLLLAREPDREIVVGTVVIAPAGARQRGALTPEDYKRLSSPGLAKATMNFHVSAAGRGGSVVTTETRIFATSAAARRRFAAYWRVIYPGSALIRRMWLRAIQHRAESPS